MLMKKFDNKGGIYCYYTVYCAQTKNVSMLTAPPCLYLVCWSAQQSSVQVRDVPILLVISALLSSG
jgi:hypothetical protein